MKPIIIAIVGDSGTGKTYMAEFLKRKMNIPVIVSYTTRPMRPNEINGVDHRFIRPEVFPEQNEWLAYTMFGGHHYCATHQQVPLNGICTYVIDEAGLDEMTLKYSDKYTVIAVNVIVDEDILIQRGITYERIARDRNRKKLHDEYYDAVILNNGTVEEFEEKILKLINEQ